MNNLSILEKRDVLTETFPEQVLIVGSKNLNKIATNPSVKTEFTRGGANIGYLEVVEMLVQAVTFIDIVFRLYKDYF